MIFKSHESDKLLADQFVSFFQRKLGKLEIFFPSGTENDVHPPCNPSKIYTEFPHVSGDAVDKIFRNLPTVMVKNLNENVELLIVTYYCHQ